MFVYTNNTMIKKLQAEKLIHFLYKVSWFIKTLMYLVNIIYLFFFYGNIKKERYALYIIKGFNIYEQRGDVQK